MIEELERELMLPIRRLVDMQDGVAFLPTYGGERDIDLGGLFNLVSRLVMAQPLDSCRDRENVIARIIIAYRLRYAGYSTVQVGRMLKKNHSTITHYERKMEFALKYPNAFPKLVKLWNIVIKEYPL